jgi:hypothetical protein
MVGALHPHKNSKGGKIKIMRKKKKRSGKTIKQEKKTLA